MREYDSIGLQWIPYTMFTQNSDHKSSVVNTDNYGLRYTGRENPTSMESIQVGEEFSLIVGASTAFGVGASSDDETIAAQLHRMTGELTINLSGKAYNSKQELTLFLHHVGALKGVKRVVLVSGANNLYCSSFAKRLYDPMFFGDLYLKSMKNSQMPDKKNLFRFGSRKLRLSELVGTRLRPKKDHETRFTRIANSGVSYTAEIEAIDIDAAMRRTCDDLYIWKMLSNSMGFELIFCLQPMPGWCNKILSPEEETLFYVFDNVQNSILERLDSKQTGLQYGNSLESFCKEKDITFINLNQSLKDNKEWLFVDRLHLTDAGYGYVAKDIFNTIGKSVQ